MRTRHWAVLACFTALAASASQPVRLGAPAPDWTVESASGKPASLSRHLQQRRRDAVILALQQGQPLSRAELEKAAAALAQHDSDLLVLPPQSDGGRPGLGPAAPATILVDSRGIVRRIEPGRLLAGKKLGEFVDQWRLGREVFLTACARCHGDDGSLQVCGDVKPLTGIGNRLTPAQVYDRLRVGELSQHEVLVRGRFHKREEIEAVVVFVRGL